MKISKLFHWLYGLIMLLPIFAIGTTCLISTFNMSAKEEAEIIYKYETNEVNSVNDLIVGNAYTLKCKDLMPSDMQVYEFFILPINEFTYQFNSIDDVYTDVDYSIYPLSYIALNQVDYMDLVYISDSLGDMYLTVSDVTFTSNIDFIFINKNIEDNVIINNVLLSNISKCENIPISSVETYNVETQDVFYNAVDKVTTSPLFSWAYNSFLATPFTYIASIFSIPSNSVIVQLLSYWLAISIIWLVFDLIMYVPLLVHRWLDKGVLE